MEVKAVLLFVVIVIPASVAFQWTSSQIPDGSSFRACVGERVSFPWSFSLSTGERVINVEWYRTTGKDQLLVAGLLAGHFFPAAGQNVTFVPGAGLQVCHVSLAEFGTYSVWVNYNNNGSHLTSQQRAFLTMEDAPVLADDQMVASLGPEPVLDDVTGLLHIQLMCGHFLSLGSRPVSVVWKTPSDHTVASTAYINGTFRLKVPHPTQGGRYYCHLKDPSVAARCVPNVSRLMRGAYIHLDEVQIRLTLLEGGLQGSQAKDEKLDREMERQADLDSELQSREKNLTAEVGRLAKITAMLLTRTENLTSDNEKLKIQTDKLTSDNENMKTQTQKLTSDNDGLKTQMQSVTSQLKAETDVHSKRAIFHVELGSDQQLSRGARIKLGVVHVNEGNAYNLTTGEFAVPYSGHYYFTANAGGGKYSTSSPNVVDLFLKIDGRTVYNINTMSVNYYDIATCSYAGHLNKGQKVWVQAAEPGYYSGSLTSFSGFLVYPDLLSSQQRPKQ